MGTERNRYTQARLSLAQQVLRVRLTERNMHDLDRKVIYAVVELLAAVENDADLAPAITSSALRLVEAIGVEP